MASAQANLPENILKAVSHLGLIFWGNCLDVQCPFSKLIKTHCQKYHVGLTEGAIEEAIAKHRKFI